MNEFRERQSSSAAGVAVLGAANKIGHETHDTGRLNGSFAAPVVTDPRISSFDAPELFRECLRVCSEAPHRARRLRIPGAGEQLDTAAGIACNKRGGTPDSYQPVNTTPKPAQLRRYQVRRKSPLWSGNVNCASRGGSDAPNTSGKVVSTRTSARSVARPATKSNDAKPVSKTGRSN